MAFLLASIIMVASRATTDMILGPISVGHSLDQSSILFECCMVIFAAMIANSFVRCVGLHVTSASQMINKFFISNCCENQIINHFTLSVGAMTS